MAFKYKDSDGVEHELLTAQEQTEAINKAARGVLREELKTLGPQLTKTIGDALQEHVKATVDEAIRANSERPGNTEQKPGDKQVNVKDTPEWREMERRIEASNKLTEQLKQERDAEKSKSRNNALREAALTQLQEAGFSDPVRAKHALGHIVDSQKWVAYEDDASEKILFTGADGERLLLAAGLKEWAKSEEAKLYLPPRGAGGSGSGAGQAGPRRSPGGESTTREAAAEALTAVLTGGGT